MFSMENLLFFKTNVIVSPLINKDISMNIGHRIKTLRLDMGLTQDALARKLNIHPKQLAKYESNRSTPILGIVARIADFCEVTTDFLIFGDDKNVSKKTKINDIELMDVFRRVNRLKKADRDKIKWVVSSLLQARLH